MNILIIEFILEFRNTPRSYESNIDRNSNTCVLFAFFIQRKTNVMKILVGRIVEKFVLRGK